MRNCPSAVVGAQTKAQPTPDGVDVRITANDARARERIVMLANMQSAPPGLLRFLPPHTGMRSGPGSQGFCPIIHAGTMVTFDPLPDGVVVHVRASSPDQVAELQQATNARIRALTMPSS